MLAIKLKEKTGWETWKFIHWSSRTRSSLNISYRTLSSGPRSFRNLSHRTFSSRIRFSWTRNFRNWSYRTRSFRIRSYWTPFIGQGLPGQGLFGLGILMLNLLERPYKMTRRKNKVRKKCYFWWRHIFPNSNFVSIQLCYFRCSFIFKLHSPRCPAHWIKAEGQGWRLCIETERTLGMKQDTK